MEERLLHVFRNTPLGRETLLQSIYFCKTLDVGLQIYVPQAIQFLMYFDHDFATRSIMEDYLRQFINSRRDYHVPTATPASILKNGSVAFGEPQALLKKMSRKELARLYRQKALDMHPDKGGDHDKFVKLTEAYHALLKIKK